MSIEKERMRDTEQKVNRRGMLRSISATAVGGAAIVSLSGTANAANDCPDLNSNEEYVDCDNVSEEIDYFYRPDVRRVEGETSLSVGLRGHTGSNCNDCVYYFFDLVGLHEAYGDSNVRGDRDYVDTFGFRCDTNNAIPDPQPRSSTNIESGVTDPNSSTSPNGVDEDAFWALGDVVVGAGSVLYPQLGVPAFLYTLTRASSLNNSVNNNQVVFNKGLTTPNVDSAGFGYYNMRVQVPTFEAATVSFESFTETTGRENTVSTKRFVLDDHVPSYQPRDPPYM